MSLSTSSSSFKSVNFNTFITKIFINKKTFFSLFNAPVVHDFIKCVPLEEEQVLVVVVFAPLIYRRRRLCLPRVTISNEMLQTFNNGAMDVYDVVVMKRINRILNTKGIH